jgi:tetratricopeptide (TPR) repeat protein
VGLTLAYLGRRDEAGDHFLRSIQVAEAIRSSIGEQLAVGNMAELYYRSRGEFEAGLAFLDGHVAHMRSHQDEFAIASLQAQRAVLLAALGCYAAAIEEMKAMLDVAERLASLSAQAQALAFIGRMHAELGDHGAARPALDQALERVEGRPGALSTDVAGVLGVQAYVACLEGGEPALRRALALAERALELLQGEAWKFLRVDVQQTAAWVHLLLGDAQAALVDLVGVRAVRDIIPIPAEAYLLLSAQVLRAAGRDAESRAFLQQAYERVTQVAARFADEALRQSWLENVRANRAIVAEWRALTG